jgi:hypothetical protein
MRTLKRLAPRFRRFLLGVILLSAGMALFAQTVRQNETISFNGIKVGLDERKIKYTERDLLAEYGVFGKSIFTGNAAPQQNPFLFVFPVLDCYHDLAFSLAARSVVPATATAPETETDSGEAVIFLGDAWSPSNAALNDLLESLDNPENAILMYVTLAENMSFAVTFFQGPVKNPYHLTGAFAKRLVAHNIRFSFRDKDIVLDTDAFPDTEEAASFLLDFAANRPPPETDPDMYYIAADFHGKKLMLGNVAILKIVLLASATFLFVALFFAVIFNKKRVFFIMMTCFFVFAGILLLSNPFRPRKDNTADNVADAGTNKKENTPDVDTSFVHEDDADKGAKVNVKRTVFLDRIIYTIRAEYENEPYRIALFYDYDRETNGLPGEVYESPFPYEIDGGRITFTLGEYPPNPFETELSFPRSIPGVLTIAMHSEHDTVFSVWTEKSRDG